MSAEDHRANKPGICGVTTFDSSGREWICIKKVHAKVYQRHRHHEKGPIFSTNMTSESHYMVPRWPNRSNDEPSSD